MVRDIREDFESLLGFVANYDLSGHLQNSQYVKLLSSLHKRYFAILTLGAEMSHQRLAAAADNVQNEEFERRFREAASDLGSSLFAWVHGAYKPARVVLRSGIENFIKAVGSIEFPQVVSMKKVWEIFDLVFELPFYKASVAHRELFLTLTSYYAEMNLDVHTATSDEMQHVSALGHFPHFDAVQAADFDIAYRNVVDAMVTTLCLMYPNFYREMHFRNRDIVMFSFSAEAKLELA